MTAMIERPAMSIELAVQRRSAAPGQPAEEALLGWANAAAQGRAAGQELVIRIVDKAESRKLNRRYRGKDRPTNVLSFPFEAPPGVPLVALGDLVICAPVVAREALEQGKEPAAHWAHLVVHGVLHLRGFDHQDENAAASMERLEVEILASLGFADPYGQ